VNWVLAPLTGLPGPYQWAVGQASVVAFFCFALSLVPWVLGLLEALARSLLAFLVPNRKGKWAVAPPVRTATQSRSVKFLQEERAEKGSFLLAARVREGFQIGTGGVSTPGVWKVSDPEALDLEALRPVSKDLFGAGEAAAASGPVVVPAEYDDDALQPMLDAAAAQSDGGGGGGGGVTPSAIKRARQEGRMKRRAALRAWGGSTWYCCFSTVLTLIAFVLLACAVFTIVSAVFFSFVLFFVASPDVLYVVLSLLLRFLHMMMLPNLDNLFGLLKSLPLSPASSCSSS